MLCNRCGHGLGWHQVLVATLDERTPAACRSDHLKSGEQVVRLPHRVADGETCHCRLADDSCAHIEPAGTWTSGACGCPGFVYPPDAEVRA